MMAAFTLTKTGRDALYFQGDGLNNLPRAYLGIALLAGPAAMSALGMMRLIGPRPTRVITTLGMSAMQMVFYWAAEPGGGLRMTLVFVMIPVLYGVLLAQAWLLASDLLEGAPRSTLPRLYSTLGAASLLGGLTGAAAARSLAPIMEARDFMWAGAILLVAAAAVMSVGAQVCPAARMARESAGARPAPSDGIPDLRTVLGVLAEPYPALLAGVGVVASLVGVLIEFQFYWSTAGQANVSLFASFYMALNGAALAVQVLAMPPLQRRFGVQGSLLVLPAALLGGATLIAVSASALARAGLRVAESGLKSSIHRANWEQAYLPLDRQHRAIAKLLVDGVASRVGEGAAAGLLLLGMGQAGVWITYVLLAGSMVWLALTMKLGIKLSALNPGDFVADIPVPDG